MPDKPRKVNYETSLITHIDLLGFRSLVKTKTPGDISKVLRLFTEAVGPGPYRSEIPDLTECEYVSFSDLHISVIPTRRKKAVVRGMIFRQLMRLVFAQLRLFFDHDIVIRGGVVVGDAVRSYGKFFGQGIIDAYDVESTRAVYPRIVVSESVFAEIMSNPLVAMHGDPDRELRQVKGLLHHDQENGVYYIDYLRVLEGELHYLETYTQQLFAFADKVDSMLENERDPKARAKLEWMQRYHRRISKQRKLK
jgi:hypothetical protein